jgi:hypothetical protein
MELLVTPPHTDTDDRQAATVPSRDIAAALESARRSGIAPAGWIERRERTSPLETRYVSR